MKTLILILTSLVSISTFAATPVTNFSLMKTRTNGPVDPQYGQSTTCKIVGATVSIVTTGKAIQFPHEMLRGAVFTTEIPNETVMESLANEAALAGLQNFAGPIGGGLVSYTANVNNADVTLKETRGMVLTAQNPSSAAAKLEQFMDSNCN